jgi:broad-specificity NMP kinase
LEAGEGTVAEILKEYDYKHFSMRDFIAERGLKLNCETHTFTTQ